MIGDKMSCCALFKEEDFSYAEDYGESAAIFQDESSELAETDFISKLNLIAEKTEI